MEITLDKHGTVININFCCKRIARKILPSTSHEITPIVIRQPHGIVEGDGITFFYCPYCGEEIKKEGREDIELYDPFGTEEDDKDKDSSSDNRNMRKLVEEMESEEYKL